MRKFFKFFYNKWKNIKFMKKIITFSISFIIIYTGIQVYLNYLLSQELAPVLTQCVYTFFGTELAACAAIKIFHKESGESSDEEIN